MNFKKMLTAVVVGLLFLILRYCRVNQACAAPAVKRSPSLRRARVERFMFWAGPERDAEIRECKNDAYRHERFPSETTGWSGPKRVAMAINYPDLIYYAYNGTDVQRHKVRQPTLRGGATSGATRVIIAADSPIRKPGPEGKTVAVGAQGSATSPHRYGPARVAELTAKERIKTPAARYLCRDGRLPCRTTVPMP